MNKQSRMEFIVKFGKKVKKLLFDESFISMFRKSKTDFTRNRKLTFGVIVTFTLTMGAHSIQNRLTSFFGLGLFDKIKSKCPTPSAYTQARSKFSYLVFNYLNNILVKDFYKTFHNDIQRWKGFRVTAIDGSRIYLQDYPDIQKEFGVIDVTNKSYKGIYCEAMFSSFYDVLNHIHINTLLKPRYTTEASMAIELLEEDVKDDDLVLFDRGYGGYNFFACLISKNVSFVCRMRSDFKGTRDLFCKDCKVNSKTITIYPDSKAKQLQENGFYKNKINPSFQNSIKIRYVRVVLDDGTIEVLATNLYDEEEYPNEVFKELYFKRWGIETSYNVLKNRLKIECSTGKSAQSVKQDIFAMVFLSNVESILSKDANTELTEKCFIKGNKHTQKVNKATSIGLLKNEYIVLLFLGKMNQKSINILKEKLKANPVAYRKGRKAKRKKISNGKKANYYKRIIKIIS